MQELKLIPPYPMFGPGAESFPDSPEKPDGVISVTWRDRQGGGMVDIKANVVTSH
jgi:hypothetical protein